MIKRLFWDNKTNLSIRITLATNWYIEIDLDRETRVDKAWYVVLAEI